MFGSNGLQMLLGGNVVHLLLLLPVITLSVVSVVYCVWEAIWKWGRRETDR